MTLWSTNIRICSKKFTGLLGAFKASGAVASSLHCEEYVSWHKGQGCDHVTGCVWLLFCQFVFFWIFWCIWGYDLCNCVIYDQWFILGIFRWFCWLNCSLPPLEPGSGSSMFPRRMCRAMRSCTHLSKGATCQHLRSFRTAVMAADSVVSHAMPFFHSICLLPWNARLPSKDPAYVRTDGSTDAWMHWNFTEDLNVLPNPKKSNCRNFHMSRLVTTTCAFLDLALIFCRSLFPNS